MSKPQQDSEMIPKLVQQFDAINRLLYNTSVPCEDLENLVMPFIADDVIFVDPWQEGGNKKFYSIGMKGVLRTCFTFKRMMDYLQVFTI
jgi:hypothetical protein